EPGRDALADEGAPGPRVDDGPRGHAVEDPAGQRAVRMIEDERAHVLVLHADDAPRPRHPRKLADDRAGVEDMKEHGHREGAVEAVRGKAQASPVSHPEVDATVQSVLPRQAPGR